MKNNQILDEKSYMNNMGKKSKWGIYIKYFDKTEVKHWYRFKFQRDKALKELIPHVGPNKMIWSAMKCSD